MEKIRFQNAISAETPPATGLGIQSHIPPENESLDASEKNIQSRQKKWARERYQGMEALLMPSFSTDFKTFDEEGIRNDVRNSIHHGFFSVFCFPVGIGTSLEKHQQLIQIACDEAKGKIMVGATIIGKPLQDDLEMIKYCEICGCSHLLITPDSIPFLRPQTEEKLYASYLARITATSLPVVLYARVAPHYRNFGPDGIPLRVFDRLADLPNVIAVKVSQPVSLTATFRTCEMLNDRLLIGPTNLDFVPLLAKHYRIQWSGQWNVEAVQSPQKPYGVEMMKLFGAGRHEDAMQIFDILEPAHDAFFQLQMPLIRKNVHPWAHNKYFQWCVGGNGGLLPEFRYQHNDVPVLDAAERKLIRDTYHKVGIQTTSAPEEEFLVGKAGYARGVRASDLPETPYYKL